MAREFDKTSLIGKRFGKLLVIDYSHYKIQQSSGRKITFWLCECDCGNKTTVRRIGLTSRNTRSCGCLKNEPRELDDSIIGKKYGLLTVIEFAGYGVSSKNKRYTLWKCGCDCGGEKITSRNALVNGGTKSCGCLEIQRNLFLKGKGIQSNILPPGEASFNGYYANYIERAKKLKIEFNLSKEDFKNLIYQNCHYCGNPPNRPYPPLGKKKPYNGYIYINGIDRVDSNKEIGYILSNCVPCCEICNKAKRDLPPEEFQDWINRLIKFQTEKLESSDIQLAAKVNHEI